MIKKINIPITSSTISDLNSGDEILLSGKIYTARDAAHKKLLDLYERNQELPINLDDAVIYYAGPTDTKPGTVIGSIGPTTSSRMDDFFPLMVSTNVRAMIGKGPRSKEIKKGCLEHKMLYLIACGGCGALLSRCVKQAKIVAFEELGCESIKELIVKDLPLIVAYDTFGNDVFDMEDK